MRTRYRSNIQQLLSVSIPLASTATPFSLTSADVKAILLQVRRVASRGADGEGLREEVVHAGLLGIADAVRNHNSTLGPFTPFLKRSIETRILDAYRTERRREKRFPRIEDVSAANRRDGDNRDDIEIVTAASIFRDELSSGDPYSDPGVALLVRQFLESLPGRLRYVARRLYWDDASQADVARELGVTPSAVTKYIDRIRALGDPVLGYLKTAA